MPSVTFEDGLQLSGEAAVLIFRSVSMILKRVTNTHVSVVDFVAYLISYKCPRYRVAEKVFMSFTKVCTDAN